MSAPAATTDILTVDVEDWFHILEADGAHERAAWGALESRVEANTDALLALFAGAGARATFFVVGWVAMRHPALVRRIADAGHELASHSFWHEVMRRHDRASLRADLAASRRVLEDAAGRAVTGFRAPGASITPATAWVFDLIVEAGFRYDASLCPGLSSHGGFPSPFFGPHRVRCAAGELAEIPSATVGLAGRRVPYAGGGYLRLLPAAAIRACIARDHRAGRPTNLYVHPREIDPAQPRMALPWKRRFKYYVGLSTTRAKLAGLLRTQRWVGAGEWLDAHAAELADRVLDVRALAARAVPAPEPGLVPPPPPLATAPA
jgi:polysaccharide deacetylase family protein (PEP-CTERM system associated)